MDDEAGSYVAPRPRSPGTPSPEALARLQAAVSRAPVTQRPAAQQGSRAAAPAAPRAADRPRFGINTLINRMTGHSEQPERAQPVLRPQGAAVQAYDEEEAPDPDHDRIEIPAFLRRQAN